MGAEKRGVYYTHFPKDFESRMKILTQFVSGTSAFVYNSVGSEWESIYDVLVRTPIQKNMNSLFYMRTLMNYGFVLLRGDLKFLSKTHVKRREDESVYARPSSNLAIRWMSENKLSLQPVLGAKVAWNEKMSPYNTYKFFRFLYNNLDISISHLDVMQNVGKFHDGRFRNLSKMGLIETLGFNPGEDKLVYHVDKKIPNKIYFKALRCNVPKKAVKYLNGHNDIIKQEIEELGFSESYSAKILFCLRSGGYLSHMWQDAHSMISLTESGRKFCREFIMPLEEIALDETVTLPDLSNDDMDSAFAIVEEQNSHFNKVDSAVRKSEVLEVIKNNPQGISRIDIAGIMNLSETTIYGYCKRLAKEGTISKITEKRVKLYLPI